MAFEAASRSCSMPSVIGPSLIVDVIREQFEIEPGISPVPMQGGEKGACRIARLVEEDLIAQGWPQGRDYGTVQALVERFGMGRAVIREAARILEARGAARMMRGPHGGLRVLRLDPAQTTDFLVGFAAFCGVTTGHVAEARNLLRRGRCSIEGSMDTAKMRFKRQAVLAFDFIDTVFDAIGQVTMRAEMSENCPTILLSADALGRSRAGQIAGRMLGECTVEQWLHGHRLGSEADLCYRYGTDRDAFRQAVRILESAGAVEAICGRGHGLMSKAPSLGAVARLASCQYASMGIGPATIVHTFHLLAVEIIALAATKSTRLDCDRLEQSLRALDDALGRRELGEVLVRVFEIEEAILAACDNPLLQLFAQSLRPYPARAYGEEAQLMALNSEFLRLSYPILAAFRANDVSAAIEAQRARAAAMLAAWRRVLPE